MHSRIRQNGDRQTIFVRVRIAGRMNLLSLRVLRRGKVQQLLLLVLLKERLLLRVRQASSQLRVGQAARQILLMMMAVVTTCIFGTFQMDGMMDGLPTNGWNPMREVRPQPSLLNMGVVFLFVCRKIVWMRPCQKDMSNVDMSAFGLQIYGPRGYGPQASPRCPNHCIYDGISALGLFVPHIP